eukprot:266095_1
MAYIVSAKLRLLVLICIVGFFFGSASTQNRRPRRKSSLGTGRRRVMNSLDRSSLRGVSVYNVDKYGASGNGWSDDSTAFGAAWQGACTSALPSVFLVPEGKKYLVRPINFKGPCSAPGLTVLISGTIVAPTDLWNSEEQGAWLQFSNLQETTIQGGGIVDGSGQKWWAYSCANFNSQSCVRKAPLALGLNFCKNVALRNITVQNSPGEHVKLYSSSYVEVSNLQITAPGDSPNTDGMKIAMSQNVVIRNSTIGTGDDCVAIITGSSDIQIYDIVCGPGHGISIGSLGENNARDTVSNVVVRGAKLTDTTNGLRIKTWQGGSGYAQNISYENVIMNNVSNPIIIDQYYCDPAQACRNQSSAVYVNNVTYKGISGTSATPQAIKLACSRTVPCTNIVMQNVNIQTKHGSPATAFVLSVKDFFQNNSRF